jgi:tetratricopeptide (TPR) repeat protein
MLLTLLDTKAAEDLRKGVRLVDSCLQLLECERKREHELDSVSAKWGLSIEVVGLYGVLLLKLKRTAAALRVFQTLLTEPEGSNSEDKSRRGRIILIIVPYLREAEWNALALKMLTRVKEHVAWREWPVREQARLWTLLGDVHDALNDFNNAIQAYLETLRLDTNSTSVMVTLSRLARTKRLDMLQHAFEITRMHVLFFLSVVTLETGSLSWDELQLEGNLLIELAQMCHQLEKVHDFLCVGLPIVRAWLAENVPARPRGAIRATYEMIKRRMEEVEADDPVMEHGMEVEQIKFNVLARVVCDLVRVDGELFEVMLGTVNCLCDVGRISAATDILRHALRSPCLTANQKAALSFDFQGMLNDDSARYGLEYLK